MQKNIPLTKDISIPAIGLGTWQLTGSDCVEGVEYALTLGYKAIDTADAYGNHRQVAEGIKKSGVKREDFFLTTKIWNDQHTHDGVSASGERFLKELEVDYIDLLLIHWPMRNVPIEETLAAMNELKERGIVKAIGVSNFNEHHLEDVLKVGVDVVNNQVEIRPQWNQKALRDFCASKNISITAYSSLRGGDPEVPVIVELAGKYGKTPSQVILNWVTARGMIVIPKSAHKGRIKENLESQDFEIEEADLAKIDELPQTGRTAMPSFQDFDY
jgi:diketogulonate reductase-like aldo/keto reductase